MERIHVQIEGCQGTVSSRQQSRILVKLTAGVAVFDVA
jgi:hypothetical protein